MKHRILIYCLSLGIGLFSTALSYANEAAIPQFAETSISGIHLLNPSSVTAVLGMDLNETNNKKGSSKKVSRLNRFDCFNEKKNEGITFVAYGSEPKNRVVILEVRKNAEISGWSNCHLKNIPIFKTGKGISIGLPLEKVVKILGKPHKEKTSKNTKLIHYEIQDPQMKNPFLAKFQKSRYISQYKFTDNKLTFFYFGFFEKKKK